MKTYGQVRRLLFVDGHCGGMHSPWKYLDSDSSSPSL